MAVQGFGKAQLGRLTSAVGQTAPSSFVTAAAGLAPIADVPGGGRGEGYGPHSDPPITPPVRPVSIRLRGSAAPASPMRHIAPWMRLPLAPVGAPPPPRGAVRPALLRASSASRRALSGIALRAEKRGKAPACAWSWKDAVSATRKFESSRPSHPVRSPAYCPATPRNWRGCALFRRWRACLH